MRRLAPILVLSTALALSATIAQAQTMKIGLAGKVVTATATAPNNASVDAYTTPLATKVDPGFFVLTQVCVDDEGNIMLSGSTMGEIPLMDDCTSFSPGLALPPGEVLTFTNFKGSPHPVVLTGVVSRK